MGMRIRFGSGGRGSAGKNPPSKGSRDMIDKLIPPGRRAPKMSHKEIEEAVERYLRDGGTIKMLPETWYQVYQSEKMIWGFEG